MPREDLQLSVTTHTDCSCLLMDGSLGLWPHGSSCPSPGEMHTCLRALEASKEEARARWRLGSALTLHLSSPSVCDSVMGMALRGQSIPAAWTWLAGTAPSHPAMTRIQMTNHQATLRHLHTYAGTPKGQRPGGPATFLPLKTQQVWTLLHLSTATAQAGAQCPV